MKSMLSVLPILLLAAPLAAQPIAGEEVIEPGEKQLKQLRALTPSGAEKRVGQ